MMLASSCGENQVMLAAAALLVATGNLIPVDHVPPGREIVGSAVLVLQVVGVFPHVIAHHGIQTTHQRAILIGRRNDRKLAALVEYEPRPAGAKTLDARVVESSLELVEGAERLLNGARQRVGGLAASIGLHDGPEHAVIGMAASIVLYSRANILRHILNVAQHIVNALAGKVGIIYRVVQVVDIGGMVLVVMQLHRLCVNVWLQRIVVIRQWWNFKSHNNSP